MNKHLLGMHTVIEYPATINLVPTASGFRVEIIDNTNPVNKHTLEKMKELVHPESFECLENLIPILQRWVKIHPEVMVDWVEGIVPRDHLRWTMTVKKFCELSGLQY